MERVEAIKEIRKIINHDLRPLADKYQVTVFKNGNKNKGWAGHVIERYLGLPINSSQSPNFGSWELKTVSLKYKKDGTLTMKETMAITRIDPYNIVRTEFEDSHLLNKLKKIVIVARIWINQEETESILKAVTAFDLDDPEIYEQIKQDYNLIRNTIETGGKLSGTLGVYVQPRTKGTGHGSTTRAFYARVPFLNRVILPLINGQ